MTRYIIGILYLFFALPVFAAGTIDVSFEAEPLFSEANILPGDSVSRDVSVLNLSDVEQDVYIKAVNVSVSGSLADVLMIEVKEGSTTYFSIPLSEFFDGTPRALTQNLPEGDSASYAFSVFFNATSGDAYQGSAVAFDFCIGFSGGNSTCVTDGNGTSSSSSGSSSSSSGGSSGGGSSSSGEGVAESFSSSGNGSGGGGGSLTLAHLIVFNEKAESINEEEGFATITWNSNMDATSRVVFGLKSGAPYSINLSHPNFGYPETTFEDSMLTTFHIMPLSGLIQGETYVARVVSRQFLGGQPSVSSEFEFTLKNPEPSPLLSFPFESDGVNAPGVSPPPASNFFGRGVAEAAIGEDSTDSAALPEESATEDVSQEDMSQQAAAAGIAFGDFLSLQCVMLALGFIAFAYLAWLLFDRRNGDRVEHQTRALRRLEFFMTGDVLGLVAGMLFGYPCIIPPLLVFLALFVAWYFVVITTQSGVDQHAKSSVRRIRPISQQ